MLQVLVRDREWLQGDGEHRADGRELTERKFHCTWQRMRCGEREECRIKINRKTKIYP